MRTPRGRLTSRSALAAFLVEAHRHGYAAVGDLATVPPLLPGFRQLEYADGPFLARDLYVGSRSFIGQETVYFRDDPLWAMVYAGRVLGAEADEAEASRIYAFLRAALGAVNDEAPYRGPSSFGNGGMRYTNEIHGDLEAFWGIEQIRAADGRDLYRLRYAGGVIR